ncbi:methionyl-tRNA formyltransferase [Patescibacteria group bacterium]
MAFDFKKYKLAFLGTPDFAVPALEGLVKAGYDIAAVYTNPDKSRGRSSELLPSPVKEAALRLGISPNNIRQPEKFSGNLKEEKKYLESLDLDIAIVVAYGNILPAEILDVPRLGFLNVHASLLPRWRGAAPIQAAITAGDTETGVTLMQIEPSLDTGPIFAQSIVKLNGTETSPELFKTLSQLGSNLLNTKLPNILEGELKAVPQPEDGATVAKQIKKRESIVDWQENAETIERKFRAYQPWPGMHTFYNNKRLVIEGMHVHPGGTLQSGEVAAEENNTLAVGTADGRIAISQLKLEGKSSMSAGEFLCGHPEIIGSIL